MLQPKAVIDLAALHYPVRVWYHSQSHKKDRYYVHFDLASHRIHWSYAPGDGLWIASADHLAVVLVLCSVANYHQIQIHEKSES